MQRPGFIINTKLDHLPLMLFSLIEHCVCGFSVVGGGGEDLGFRIRNPWQAIRYTMKLTNSLLIYIQFASE